MTDDGQAILHKIGYGSRYTWTASAGWTRSFSAGTPGGIGYDERNCSVSCNGLVACVSYGETIDYDLRISDPAGTFMTNLPSSNSQHVMGFKSINMGYAGKPLISVTGIGFIDMLNGLIELPTPTSPLGVTHPAGKTTGDTSALWGVFLK